MTIPQEAIEAAKTALKSCEDFTEEVAATLLDSWSETVTGIVLTAALPHIREQIAQEIRTAKRTGLARTEAYGWHNNALDKAARIVEGKQ